MSCELDSMSKLSRFVYIKIHVILHVTSKAQKVNYIWLDKFISYVIRVVWQNQLRAELSGSVDHNFCSLLSSKWLLLTQRKSRRWNYVSLVRFLVKISAQPHTIVKKLFSQWQCTVLVIFFSIGSFFFLSKNWMRNVVWGWAEILPDSLLIPRCDRKLRSKFKLWYRSYERSIDRSIDHVIELKTISEPMRLHLWSENHRLLLWMPRYRIMA